VTRHVIETIDDKRIQVSALAMGSEPSAISPVTGEAFEMIETAARQSLSAKPPVVAPYLMLGATDARHYAGLSPYVYRFRPHRLDTKDLERIHGINERIGVENHAESIQFFYQPLKNYD
jgi:carboxypeptidase PM20D1